MPARSEARRTAPRCKAMSSAHLVRGRVKVRVTGWR